MSPLLIEAFHPTDQKWVKFGEAKPKDPFGFIADNQLNKQKDIFVFKCAKDDLGSIIYRYASATEEKMDGFRVITNNSEPIEIVRKLKDGESHEIAVKMGANLKTTRLRFTHKKAT